MWRILYDYVDHEFGAVEVSRVEIGADYVRSSDIPNPQEDGVGFGLDFTDPGDVLIHLSVYSSPASNPAVARAAVLAAAREFSRIWNAAAVRAEAGAVAELYAGELGMFEGRPRPVQWDLDNYASGHLSGQARFVRGERTVHPLDVDGEAVWHNVAVSALGTQAEFEVEGSSPAWPVITIPGPLPAGGQIDLEGEWIARLNRSIASGSTAKIDTRPGRRLMTLNGAPVNLLLPSGAVISEMWLPPGPRTAKIFVSSPGAAPGAVIKWRTTDIA